MPSVRTKSTSASGTTHPTENCGGRLVLLICQRLAIAMAVNLDALNLTKVEQALLYADYHRAACDRFAPA